MLEIGRAETVQPRQPVGPGDADDAPVRPVDQAHAKREPALLGGRVTVVRRHPSVNAISGYGTGQGEQRAVHVTKAMRPKRVRTLPGPQASAALAAGVSGRARQAPATPLVPPSGAAISAPAEHGQVPDIGLEAILLVERRDEGTNDGPIHLDDPSALTADQVNVVARRRPGGTAERRARGGCG